jgi:hypothetical protein
MLSDASQPGLSSHPVQRNADSCIMGGYDRGVGASARMPLVVTDLILVFYVIVFG